MIHILKNKYVIVVAITILIVAGGVMWWERAIIEFKMITGKSVGVEDFKFAHHSACGSPFSDEGEVRSVHGYVEWINVFSKNEYPNLPYQKFVILEYKDLSLSPSLEIFVEGDESEKIFEKILGTKNENEEFSSQKIKVSGVVVGGDISVGGVSGFKGSCDRIASLVIDNPAQITY